MKSPKTAFPPRGMTSRKLPDTTLIRKDLAICTMIALSPSNITFLINSKWLVGNSDVKDLIKAAHSIETPLVSGSHAPTNGAHSVNTESHVQSCIWVKSLWDEGSHSPDKLLLFLLTSFPARRSILICEAH